MARSRSRYVCQTCGEAFLRWEGQCRACGGVEQPRRDGRPGEPRGPRAPASGHRPTGRRAATPSATIGEADRSRACRSGSASWTGSSAAGSVPGSVVLLGGEPGIGKSTLLLQAAAGVAGASDRRASCTPPARSRPAQVRLRAARLGLLDGRPADAIQILAEHDDRPDRRGGADADPPAVARRRLRSRPRRSTSSTAPAGSVGQVRESTLRLMEFAQGRRDRGRPRRARHEGRLDRRARRRSSTSSTRSSSLEGERYAAAAPAARHEEPLRLDRRGRRVRDGASAACREVADPARAFLADHDEPAPGQRRRADPRGQPAAARRGPGAGRTGALRRRPRRRASGLDPNRLEPAASRSSAAGPASASREPRRVRQPRRRADRRASPASTCRCALALASSLARPAGRRPAPSPIGEVGLLGELRAGAGPRAAAARGGPARLQPGDRARARRVRRRPRRVDGLEIVAVATCRTRSQTALGAAPSRAWRALCRAMLG